MAGPVQPVTVLFAPAVDAALVESIDHVDVDRIPTVLDFLERIQNRLVETLSTFPEAGPVFQGEVRMFPLEGYVFLYEHHPSKGEVHVLDMIAPSRNWRLADRRWPSKGDIEIPPHPPAVIISPGRNSTMPIPDLPLQPAPDWLIQMTQERMDRDPFPLHDLLSGSLYYPSSGFDGDPIAYLGGNHLSFVCVDYGEERKGLLAALEEPGFLGYRVLCHRPVLEAELPPMGWSPVIPQGEFRRPPPGWVRPPFCEWVVLERDADFPDEHGPERFSLLFLCADGVAAFQALYVSNRVVPGTVAIIQPGTGFGGNWTDFTDPAGPLAEAVLGNPAGRPDILLHGGAGGRDNYMQPCWPQYAAHLGILGTTSIGVWRRTE